MTIALVSGKGGVGKTNLAVNLGLELVSRGLRVMLADLDLGLANADVLLGLQSRPGLTEVIRGRRGVEEVISEAYGLSFIAGASASAAEKMSPERCRRLARCLMRIDADVRLFDCSAGIGGQVSAFARAADMVLVVTTPEPTAMADAYAAVKTLFREGYGGSMRLLVNMVDSRAEALRAFERVRDVCEKFIGYPIANAGYMLHDTHVELAVRQRVPLVIRYPKSSASACAAAAAARLMSGRASATGKAGLISRIAGLFV